MHRFRYITHACLAVIIAASLTIDRPIADAASLWDHDAVREVIRVYRTFLDSVQRPTNPPRQTAPQPQKHTSRQPKNRPTSLSPQKRKSRAKQIAAMHGIEIEQMLAIVAVESTFKPDAVSTSGAAGLTQLKPATARWMGLQVPEYADPTRPNRNPRIDERFDPRKNLETGMKYFRYLLDRYNGNFRLAIAAYHAGPGTVDRAGGVPNRPATKRHLWKIMKQYNIYKRSRQAREEALRRLEAEMGKWIK